MGKKKKKKNKSEIGLNTNKLFNSESVSFLFRFHFGFLHHEATGYISWLNEENYTERRKKDELTLFLFFCVLRRDTARREKYTADSNEMKK